MAKSCPCGLPTSYPDCCGALHRGERAAATAELLMRSRFTAYALRDEAYLLRSWHPRTRPVEVDFDTDLRWTHLEILGATGGGLFHQEGTVEFNAHYRYQDKDDRLHENSRFERVDGAWVYLAPIS
ncbi:YchJ family protein [Crossiella cryophila]|uniref:UPF0225 protein HNR67_006666 n=1 Tax=Crossiella cryophila TaxID=43355 RepID=A0A7W7CG28_9PSEU|nr:YchJ family metal-binding protein [Crossiella cryophila]MBB4680548.1 SEC-C motif-containing protein [Crossiella cryophila]